MSFSGIGNIGPAEIKFMVQGMIILILSICVHEFGHAFVADKLGDGLPRSQGRVTLNPIAHADPIGTLLFPIVGFVLSGGSGFGFGWGRPVQVNPVAFTRRFRMRTGHMLVAAAGPTMNVLLALLVGGIHVALVKFGVLDVHSEINRMLEYAVILNFILAFFNMIPAGPLDGAAVLEGFLPDSAIKTWEQIKPYTIFLLFLIIMNHKASRIIFEPAMWCARNWYAVLM